MSNIRKNPLFLIYHTPQGDVSVEVTISDETVWLSQNQIAEIFNTTQQNVSQHIDGTFKDEELSAEATHKKFLLVQTEGKRQVKREVISILETTIPHGSIAAKTRTIGARKWQEVT